MTCYIPLIALLETGVIVVTGIIQKVTIELPIKNVNRTAGTMLSGEVAKRYGHTGLPDGTIAYTRDGSLKLSDTGAMVTSAGYAVQPSITIPNNAVLVSINKEGVVQVSVEGQPQPQQVGQLQLATFVNPAGLQAKGDNLFTETAASGPALQSNPGLDGTGTLLQGSLESSNVDSVTEITSLISAQRAYEMNTKVLSAVDQMLQSLNQTA